MEISKYNGKVKVYAGQATDTVADLKFPNNQGSQTITISNDDTTNELYVKFYSVQQTSGITNGMTSDPTTNDLVEVKQGEVLTLTDLKYRQVSIICASTETALYRIFVQLLQ